MQVEYFIEGGIESPKNNSKFVAKEKVFTSLVAHNCRSLTRFP